MPDILKKIMAYKKEEVERDRMVVSPSAIDFFARTVPPPRGFHRALKRTREESRWALIAEIKRASPSKGLIREDFDVQALARAYHGGGATCLSVLTDEPSFQGSRDFLRLAHETVELPCLCKDFMLDPYQIMQARFWGADCVLLIMAMLSPDQAAELEEVALRYDMDVLCEVHNERELSQALTLKTRLLGINNRDLHTFQTDLATTERLAPLVPEGYTIVSESGVETSGDLERLEATSGVGTFLVGESLMRTSDVEEATRTLLTRSQRGDKSTP